MKSALLPWVMAGAMPLALLIDRCGEPPTWAHPVVAIGRFLDLFGERLCALPPRAAFIGGALVWCVGALVCMALGASLQALLSHALQPWWGGAVLSAIVLALLLKPLLAWTMLKDEVLAVEAAQAQGLSAARKQLARIVSRDTSRLDATAVREAGIETLAENLNDSVVAPLFWFAVAGLPGAALYRFANTADAMWGYHGRWEWAGKWAARADDVLSWVPARLTALALLGARLELLAPLLREARRTASPNSGWPMAAMALRLKVRLGKPGVYTLNAGAGAVEGRHSHLAQGLALRTLMLCTAILTLAAAALRGGW